MRKLYFAKGAFLCRKCLNLGYVSQRLRRSMYFSKVKNKIEKELEDKGGDLHTKPKLMKHKTFKALKDRYWACHEKFHVAARKELLSYFPNKNNSRSLGPE